MRSTADSIIFNRDTDGMDAFEDPRDFEGAAGNRSETAAMSGLFSEKVDKVSFEDIPHAKFAPPGLRKVDAMGSRAEEIIYNRPESYEDTDFIEKPYYQGAAGESSVQADKRLKLEICASERALLNYLIARLHSLDADVLVGHNIAAFDVAVLLQRLLDDEAERAEQLEAALVARHRLLEVRVEHPDRAELGVVRVRLHGRAVEPLSSLSVVSAVLHRG